MTNRFRPVVEIGRMKLSDGQKIKEARLAQKMTQKELAFKCGLTQGTISMCELDCYEGQDMMVRVAACLKVKL